MKKVAIVGSSSFPLNAGIGAQIVDMMREREPGTVFLTRGKGDVDVFVGHVSLALGFTCLTYPSEGGPDNWRRDVDLARDADEIITIISRNDLELSDKTSGTLHIAEKGLDQRKHVVMMTEADGRLVWAAENAIEDYG